MLIQPQLNRFAITPCSNAPSKSRIIIAFFENTLVYLPHKAQHFWFEESEAPQLMGTHLFIGHYDNTPVFALILSDKPDSKQFESMPYRTALLSTTFVDETVIISRALQVVHWFTSYKFCHRCGHRLKHDLIKTVATCTNCEAQYFTKIAPCIIVLVYRGNQVLLAHHKRYGNKKIYSTLAGFIEAGESAEQAVHREVQEEVGLSIHNLRYMGSQSWPFPHQLMLGYFAEYAAGDIQLDEEELLEAKWWPIDDLPEYPPAFSIAGQLIEAYKKDQVT
ncbi:MAG: NAD(+) diphosphatase [Pseudomonadota bacterium]